MEKFRVYKGMKMEKDETQDNNYNIVERFINSNFWLSGYEDYYSDDFIADMPFAPPGMYQHFENRFEYFTFNLWLRRSLKSWKLDGQPRIFQTTDPNQFWTIRSWSGEVFWAGRDGWFSNEFISFIVVKAGKIAYLKDYCDPLGFYKAMSVQIPMFDYDPPQSARCARMPLNVKSQFDEETNYGRALAQFSNPMEVLDGDESVYAYDVVETCPYAPLTMPKVYTGEAFDTQTAWMLRDVVEWTVNPRPKVFLTPNPDIFIVETCGYGSTRWSKTPGHYTNREIMLIELEAGKVKRFRVYFNPIHKFSSLNISLPSFPYFF
jgi:ketosteroid isomerase-like protein